MERLDCNLNDLSEKSPDGDIKPLVKLSIIRDVALGLRYLHSHNPPIIHRDLSSNNVLISKGMKGKIGDLGTARLIDPTANGQSQLRLSQVPGTLDFMPPEALEATREISYGRELDVFSFGCVMLHTFSHQWPKPLASTFTDTDNTLKPRSEVDRRKHYFDGIKQTQQFNALKTLIRSCLANNPKDRESIVVVSNQLTDLVNEEGTHNQLNVLKLHEEIQVKEHHIEKLKEQICDQDDTIGRKEVEIHSKDKQLKLKDNEIQNNNDKIQQQAILLHNMEENTKALKSENFILRSRHAQVGS